MGVVISALEVCLYLLILLAQHRMFIYAYYFSRLSQNRHPDWSAPNVPYHDALMPNTK